MKINFLVEHIGASQLGYFLIKACNQLVAEGHDVIVFFDKMHRHHVEPHFATMQLVEAWLQQGTTIATSMSTAIHLLDFPGPRRKLFYIWDMEWMRGPQWSYGPLADLLSHEDLELIVRNEIHAKAIYNCFNILPSFIMENFDVETLKKILTHDNRQKVVN